MNTPLKFTFLHGIGLFIAALLLSFVVIYFVYWLGDRQQRRQYEKDYNYLKFLVEESDCKGTLLRKLIKRKFDEISMYSCKNYEQLQVLEKTFDDKSSDKRHIEPRIITKIAK